MYFKQIDMFGFKSFADRTSLRLEPGITAIVGPNGCGKSNVLDSMRWALGEQSAKALRGSHMQDVIFNGSDERKPTGMAEVSLTFDNSDSKLPVDFSEVQITRRVYRSGESEYLINKAPCRLRDIQELFMDTGIGTSAYSLIGQGKISMVLSSKPEDRRFLFEEAAGIIKYKSRKKVAMRKLDGAEQNLLRLGDIIAEVQRQTRSLKRQVNAAIRYRELSDELRQLEIRGAWLKFSVLVQRIAEAREAFAIAQDKYESVSGEISKLEARHEEISLSRLEVDRVLTVRREGVYEIDSEMEKIERQIALLRQQIEFGREQQKQAAEEREQLQQRSVDIDSRKSETAQRSEELQKAIEDINRTLADKQQEHATAAGQVQQADANLEAMRERTVATMNARAKAETEIETLGVTIANIQAQLDEIYDRQNDHSKRNEEVVGKLQEAQHRETELQAALADAESQRVKLADQVATEAEEIRTVNQQWQDLREKKSSAEARLASLRELRDSYEGFAVGVRAVMMAKQQNMKEIQGVIGPAGDLLSTEKKYERAIEAVLGGNINNVVVERADDAKEAIQFLRKHRAGRVTFLPLDTIRPSRNDDYANVDRERGVIGPAIDFVEHDPHIRPAIEYLFHNTVLVESIDDAIRIARSSNRYPRMVTLEGDVVTSSGAVTGGQTKHESRGLLGRSAEIEELETRASDLTGQLAKLAAREDQLKKSSDSLRGQMTQLAQQETDLRRTLNEVGVIIARQSTELDNLTQSNEALNARRDELCAKREEIEDRRRQALSRVDNMQTDDEALQREVEAAQEEAARARQALSVCTSELSDMRVQLAGLTQNYEEAERNRQREDRERENILQEAQRKLELIDQLKENEKQLDENIATEVERSKALSESKEEARKKVIEAENQRQTLLDETEHLEKSLRELREQGQGTQSEVHRLEIQLRHDEDQVEFFKTRIATEYNVVLADLKAENVGEDDYEEKERDKMVDDLRDKLQRMGTVNLMAIEEYDELCKRCDFLVAQEEDLRKARETLLNVVERIDKTIRAMFLETFDNVANSFRNYFRRLFNGGQARIYLLDEDDPLESGIEIEARPPGKKPQSISLLSGGEQAMTAIALLFSIFKAKPSPFCVLDEVDAPLDDANIGRFLSLVDEFTDESQFIIITHNKQTMAHANCLYGVTMQERGVSKLVSVKFDDVEDTESAA